MAYDRSKHALGNDRMKHYISFGLVTLLVVRHLFIMLNCKLGMFKFVEGLMEDWLKPNVSSSLIKASLLTYVVARAKYWFDIRNTVELQWLEH